MSCAQQLFQQLLILAVGWAERSSYPTIAAFASSRLTWEQQPFLRHKLLLECSLCTAQHKSMALQLFQQHKLLLECSLCTAQHKSMALQLFQQHKLLLEWSLCTAQPKLVMEWLQSTAQPTTAAVGITEHLCHLFWPWCHLRGGMNQSKRPAVLRTSHQCLYNTL